jgi:hypothetical protein
MFCRWDKQQCSMLFRFRFVCLIVCLSICLFFCLFCFCLPIEPKRSVWRPKMVDQSLTQERLFDVANWMLVTSLIKTRSIIITSSSITRSIMTNVALSNSAIKNSYNKEQLQIISCTVNVTWCDHSGPADPFSKYISDTKRFVERHLELVQIGSV